MGEDAGGGLVGCVGGVLFVVDGDAGEQGAVEDASFGWFALVVEVVEVDEEVGELVHRQPNSNRPLLLPAAQLGHIRQVARHLHPRCANLVCHHRDGAQLTGDVHRLGGAQHVNHRPRLGQGLSTHATDGLQRRPLTGRVTHRQSRRSLHVHVAREASVYLIEDAYVIARRVTNEIAARLHHRQALDTPEHLKYLTLPEIATALTEPASTQETRATASQREADRPHAAAAWWARADQPADTRLAGAAGSPGQATGPVRVITGPQDFDQLQPGDILVCHYTDPSWTPLFSLAAAIVADTGGRLSHAAIVAREYGLPAVMGAAGATTTLTNGQIITINGTTGTITI
ncbi:MAG: PEP-utilizing enzyme [Actinomyces sp.]|nr:PEP-utilizing enzyme [Actinomyces sp.]